MTVSPWFFAPVERWQEREVLLPVEESHHATSVLRVAPPDVITVCDGVGTVASCAVVSIEKGCVKAEVLDKSFHRPLRPQLVVYQGAAKGHKLDAVVQHLAELGVAELHVFSSERTVARWDDKKQSRLLERWHRIAVGAAKQSRNPYLLSITAGLDLAGVAAKIAGEPLAAALWEQAVLPLRTALVGETDRVALIVGPEGGLAAPEAEALAEAGSQLVSLGPRILRTEHAAAAAVAAVAFHYGLLG